MRFSTERVTVFRLCMQHTCILGRPAVSYDGCIGLALEYHEVSHAFRDTIISLQITAAVWLLLYYLLIKCP